MLAASIETALSSRHRFKGLEGHQAWVTEYFGTEPFANPSLTRPCPSVLHPVAFMVEEEPGAILHAHFHRADQFQVFVKGSGKLGRYEIQPFSVHYADAFTPYGPIQAGAEGLSYLTLRNAWDDGPQYMPQSHAALKASRGPGRQTPPTSIEGLGATSHDTVPTLKIILEPDHRGAGAWLSHAAPGETPPTPPAAAGGQCWVVAEGGMNLSGRVFAPLSCFFIGPGEAPPAVTAGVRGVDLIVLQFPELMAA
jgi:hypothetical protein